MTIYNLSKDYERLYNIICAGQVAAAFVDYSFNGKGGKHVFKDLCAVKKRGLWDIDFYVRGTSYDSVSDLWSHLGSEKDVFILCCEGLNLEFIPPP
jgi:hypothetical protein